MIRLRLFWKRTQQTRKRTRGVEPPTGESRSPSGAKALRLRDRNGTAKAVPFQTGVTRPRLGPFTQAAHALHFLLVNFDLAILFQLVAQVLYVEALEHLAFLVEQRFLGAVPAVLHFVGRRLLLLDDGEHNAAT